MRVFNYCLLSLALLWVCCKKDADGIEDIVIPNNSEQAFLNTDGELIRLNNGTTLKKVDTFYVYNGDIILNEHQLQILRSISELKSNTVREIATKWPGGVVPYEIRAGFSPADMAMIGEALDAYHQYTCIRFIPRKDERNYLVIKGDNSGCWSSLGRVGGAQELNLEMPGCVTKVGTIIHELAHAIGVLHEHNRPDRDEYITINFENIATASKYNFNKAPEKSSTIYGPFDYASVMLYAGTAFSRNGGPTISNIDGSVFTGGQRDGFSKWDIVGVNAMYRCAPESAYYNGYEHYLTEPNWEQLKNINDLVAGTRDAEGKFYFYPVESGDIVRFGSSLLASSKQGTVGNQSYWGASYVIPSLNNGSLLRKGESNGFVSASLNAVGNETRHDVATPIGDHLPGTFNYDQEHKLMFRANMVLDEQMVPIGTFPSRGLSLSEGIVYWGETYKWTVEIDGNNPESSVFHAYKQSNKNEVFSRGNLYTSIAVPGFCMTGGSMVYEYKNKLVVINSGTCTTATYPSGAILILDPSGKIGEQKYKVYQVAQAKWKQSSTLEPLCGGIWWKNKLMVYDRMSQKSYFEITDLLD